MQATARTAIILALLLAPFAAIRLGYIRIPPAYDPRVPLSIDAAPNFLTRYKLSRLSEDESACRAVLATARIDYESLPDKITGTNCGFHNAVRIQRTTADVSGAFSLTCRAAVSLALWEHHVLQPEALARFQQPVARIEHFGSYSCRNVYGRANATRSRHATAEAFDVAGFVLADGRRIRVVNDWREDPATSQFLHAVRDGACGYFDAVLSPDYNAAHRDHLHLDRGPFRTCR